MRKISRRPCSEATAGGGPRPRLGALPGQAALATISTWVSSSSEVFQIYKPHEKRGGILQEQTKYPDSEASPNDPLSTASADSVQQFSGVDSESPVPFWYSTFLLGFLPASFGFLWEDPRYGEAGNDLFVLVCSVRGIHLSAYIFQSLKVLDL